MSHKCEKCGDEFDSERGLHIHQSQVHEEEQENESSNEKHVESEESNSSSSKALELGIREVALVFFAIGIGIGFMGGVFAPIENTVAQPSDNTQQAENNQEQELPIEEDSVDVSNINEEGEPVLGNSDAKVTIVMYEDFQCPYCKSFEENAFQQIESNYVESGQVKIIWKDFPLSEPPINHAWADDSAAAMECVYRQDNDAFWNIKDKIFDNQRSLTESGVQSEIVSWAEQEGLSGDAVQSCIDNEDPIDEVNQDKEDGSGLDATLNGQRFVAGTPSFVVYGDNEGTALSGALPFQAFEQVIEKELQDSQ